MSCSVCLSAGLGSVRAGIERTGPGLTGLPRAGPVGRLGGGLGEEPVPPPLSSRATAHTARLPAAPLRPLTGGAKPWEYVS